MDQLEFINLSFKYILRESPKDVRKDCEDPARSCQHLNFGLSWKQSVKPNKSLVQKLLFGLTSNVLPFHFVFSSLAEWTQKFKFLYTYQILTVLGPLKISPLNFTYCNVRQWCTLLFVVSNPLNTQHSGFDLTKSQ